MKEGRDAPGEFEEGGDGLGRESGEDVVLEAMSEEGLHFFAEQAGETEAERDAPPKWEQRRAKEAIFEFRQGGEQNAEERGTVQISLGEKTDFMKGVVPDHLGLIDPEKRMNGQVAKGINQQRAGFGPGTMKGKMEGCSEEAS